MKKFLLSLFLFSCMLLGAARTFAQSADSLQVVVDSLSVKVTKLEHDLAYLKINTDISTLNTKIEILSLNVKDVFSDFQIAVLSNNKKGVKAQLRVLHEAYKERLEIIKREIDSLQELVNSNRETFSFLENMQILTGVMLVLNSYDILEKQMPVVGEELDK